MNAKVSVILPSLNVADYIRECLDSVVGQSLHELEIICIDAGSTDGTKEILAEYAQRDPRITVLHSAARSYGRQVNMGLDYARGDYVAVLETDDWIVPDMYACLYENAVADGGLDYVAADFDMFYQLQNGCYCFIRQYLFHGEKQNWYGRILDPDQIATLRASDHVLWKGIYKRGFINADHIRLHESPGAAFQDMGFLQQVKTHARKVKYLDESFYRYRQDRQGTSSREASGLRYYEREFRWIDEELKLNDLLNDIHKKYYYFTMSISFITKYEQVLTGLDGNWQDERLCGPYTWFKEQLVAAFERRILDETMYGKELWKRILLLLDSQRSHARYIQGTEKKKQRHIQEFLDLIRNRSVVIFGCGKRGERLLFFCDRNQVRVDSFCDNDMTLRGSMKSGFPIISPSDLKEDMDEKSKVVILSMRNGAEQAYRQLEGMGIGSDGIIGSMPEEVLAI